MTVQEREWDLGRNRTQGTQCGGSVLVLLVIMVEGGALSDGGISCGALGTVVIGMEVGVVSLRWWLLLRLRLLLL